MRFTGLFAIPMTLCWSPLVAHAADLPRYDVETHCERVASTGGTSSAMLKNSCIDMEQDSYNKLKNSWDSVPAETQKHCSKVASIGGSDSYMLLNSCIDMEAQAASSTKKFKY